MTVAQLVTTLVEAWNTHDLEKLVLLYAPDWEGRDIASVQPWYGPSGAQHWLTQYLRAFPDLQFTIEQVMTQGQEAVLVWRASGTHQGKFMNIPASQRRVEMVGVSLLTVTEGKIYRSVHIWDLAGLLRALRLLPELYN